jgi:hypothetical protein
MQIEYMPTWNFHNQPSITIRVKECEPAGDWVRYYLSPRQVRRIDQHFCGVTDCRCGSGGTTQQDEAGTVFAILVPLER